jgi:hypothetical protein
MQSKFVATSQETIVNMVALETINKAKAIDEEAKYTENQVAHKRHLQNAQFAFELAQQQLDNDLILAKMQEKLDIVRNAKTLSDAQIKIQENKLATDACNAITIANAQSRDTVCTLDVSSNKGISLDSSGNRNNQGKYAFSYQDHLVSQELEKRKLEHAIAIAKDKIVLEQYSQGLGRRSRSRVFRRTVRSW